MTAPTREQEFEGIGMAALIGALVLPGVFWIVRGRSTAAVVGRTIAVAAVITGAVLFEGAVDDTAEVVLGAVVGRAG